MLTNEPEISRPGRTHDIVSYLPLSHIAAQVLFPNTFLWPTSLRPSAVFWGFTDKMMNTGRPSTSSSRLLEPPASVRVLRSPSRSASRLLVRMRSVARSRTLLTVSSQSAPAATSDGCVTPGEQESARALSSSDCVVVALAVAKPTIFFAVPRVWEKFSEAIQLKGRAMKGTAMGSVSAWAKGKVAEVRTQAQF